MCFGWSCLFLWMWGAEPDRPSLWMCLGVSGCQHVFASSPVSRLSLICPNTCLYCVSLARPHIKEPRREPLVTGHDGRCRRGATGRLIQTNAETDRQTEVKERKQIITPLWTATHHLFMWLNLDIKTASNIIVDFFFLLLSLYNLHLILQANTRRRLCVINDKSQKNKTKFIW